MSLQNRVLCMLMMLLSRALQAESWTTYDSRAYSQCYAKPKALLYEGGILINPDFDDGLNGWSPNGNCALQLRNSSSSPSQDGILGDLKEAVLEDEAEEERRRINWFVVATNRTASYNGPSQLLPNLTSTLKYSVSAWLRIGGPLQKALVKATLAIDGGKQYVCVGTVMAQNGCWSFLKGGFSLDNLAKSTTSARLYFETMNFTFGTELWLDRASLQPFSDAEWRTHQIAQQEMLRRRTVSVHVVDSRTRKRMHDVNIEVVNAKLRFPFGSAIVQNILNNQPYQRWFVERFNTAVFGNELKWYATEREAGKVDYSVADAMVAWCEAQQLSVRGHNIVWEDPHFQQSWVKSLAAASPTQLREAVMARVFSVVPRYAGHLIAWDVSNEQLHFSFYEDALADPSFSTSLFLDVQRLDPTVRLFVNDYNTLENCNDPAVIPDILLAKLRQLRAAGVVNLAIGLEAHFTKPDVAYMRNTLDKLATLGLPIWLTELDINVRALANNITQAAIYLDDVLREAFSHPAVEGIVMWTAWEPTGCYRMCLTDNNMVNLATGNVVDALLDKWQEVEIMAETCGASKWRGPVGTHNVSIHWNNTSYYTSLFVEPGGGTQHFVIEFPPSSAILQTQALSISTSSI